MFLLLFYVSIDFLLEIQKAQYGSSEMGKKESVFIDCSLEAMNLSIFIYIKKLLFLYEDINNFLISFKFSPTNILDTLNFCYGYKVNGICGSF